MFIRSEDIGGRNDYVGAFYMEGGTISNCTATESDSGGYGGKGGGVCIMSNNGKFIMSGGTITGCSAEYGGGVYSTIQHSENFVISGGTITECTAKSNGGGVYLQ